MTWHALAAAFVALASPAAFGADVKVTDQATYVREDGGTDATIASCSDHASPTAGGNRQANEPAVAVNPSEQTFLAASSNDYCTLPITGDAWQGIYTSADGGLTWKNSLLVGYPGDTSAAGQASPLETNSGDPLLDWDNDGHLFAGGITFNRTATIAQSAVTPANGHVYVVTYDRDPGTPTGLAYVRTVIVGEGTPGRFPYAGRFNDKPSLRVDDWASSPHEGNVYISWTLFPGNAGSDHVLFSRSEDGGQTFSKGIKISKGLAAAQGSDIAVASDGTVYVFWREFDASSPFVESRIVFVKSTDGGKHFSNPAPVQPVIGYDRGDQYVSGGSARDCGDGPFLCATSFAFHRVTSYPQAVGDDDGNLYVVWEQLTPAASNGDTYLPDGQSRIVVTASTDGGESWSAPVAIDPQSAGHQWWSNIEYNKLTDTLGVVYYDSRFDPSYSVNRPPGNKADGTSICGVPASPACNVLNTFIATSSDGVSWTPTRVSSVGHQPEYEMFGNRDTAFHGDYLWIDAMGSTFFGVWTDNRDVVPGPDPREEVQDGFDVLQCREENPDGSFGADTCPNAGGLDQNIYGGTP